MFPAIRLVTMSWLPLSVKAESGRTVAIVPCLTLFNSMW